jgi:hypothetical protein
MPEADSDDHHAIASNLPTAPSSSGIPQSEPKGKIVWKTINVSSYLLNKPFARDAVEDCKLSIKYDFLPSNQQDLPFDPFSGNERLPRHALLHLKSQIATSSCKPSLYLMLQS